MQTQSLSSIATFFNTGEGKSTSWYSRVLIVGATSIVIGILWDISWHRTIGRDTFWTPAHLAIYVGGLLGGLTSGWLVIRTTFFGTEAERAGSVRLWGFRGPLGAWMSIWGSFAMLTSAPFDNWWHDAYGLDVKILSPPHTVLALGMWGVVLGALLLRAVRVERTALALGIAYAASDEVHQHFVTGRVGSPLDVLIDAVGVAIGVALYRRLGRRVER
jgi:hypothetical protein